MQVYKNNKTENVGQLTCKVCSIARNTCQDSYCSYCITSPLPVKNVFLHFGAEELNIGVINSVTISLVSGGDPEGEVSNVIH